MTEPKVGFLIWLTSVNGYRDVRVLPDGRWAGIRRLAFTTTLQVGQIGDFCGVDDHWCYHDAAAARAALDAWDGTGEPQGWHRHPFTGRRVSATGDEVDEDGVKVGAAGLTYVRR